MRDESPFGTFKNAETRTWAESSGLSVEAMAGRAQRFAQFRGVDKDKLAIVPKGASPDAQRATLQRLGAPTDASGYDFSKIEGLPPEMRGWAAETAAKAGLLPHQAAHIAERFAGSIGGSQEAVAKGEQADAERELKALQSEWGGAYLANTEHGRRAMRHAQQNGQDPQAVLAYLEAAVGPRAALKIAAAFGRRIAEGSFVDGETPATEEPKTMSERWYR